MAKPVSTTIPLPNGGRSYDVNGLNQFDQDLTKALLFYLSDVARRLNNSLQKDGSENMTGPLVIGSTTSTNVTISDTSIQADNNGAPAELEINPAGGAITTGAGVTTIGGITTFQAEATFEDDVTFEGNVTFDMGLPVGDTLTLEQLNLDNTAGTARLLNFATSGSFRWNVVADVTGESGSNAGSDFAIYRYSDAGSFLGQPLYIERATGDIYTEADLFVTGDINASDLSSDSLTLVGSASPTPTTQGRFEWDTDDDAITVGDGSDTKTFRPSEWEHVVTIDSAGATVFTVTDLDAYRMLRLTGFLRSVSTVGYPSIQFSSDNGSSWLNTLYEYLYSYGLSGSADAAAYATAQAAIPFMASTNTLNTTATNTFEMLIGDFNDAQWTAVKTHTVMKSAAGTPVSAHIDGWHGSATAMNALRISNTQSLEGFITVEGIRG
jgi:hypothetical protein